MRSVYDMTLCLSIALFLCFRFGVCAEKKCGSSSFVWSNTMTDVFWSETDAKSRTSSHTQVSTFWTCQPDCHEDHGFQRNADFDLCNLMQVCGALNMLNEWYISDLNQVGTPSLLAGTGSCDEFQGNKQESCPRPSPVMMMMMMDLPSQHLPVEVSWRRRHAAKSGLAGRTVRTPHLLLLV